MKAHINIGLLSIFSIVSLTMNAQDENRDFRERVRTGPKVGLSIATITKTDNPDFSVDSKIGFTAGGFLALPLGKFLGIQPEVLFSQKGFAINGRTPIDNYVFTRTTNYIDVPVFLQLKPTRYFTLLVGPQVSYLLSRTDRATSNSSIVERDVVYDNRDISDFTFGGNVGFDINIRHLLIFARYNFDITKNNADGTTTVPEYKNQVFQLGVGISLP